MAIRHRQQSCRVATPFPIAGQTIKSRSDHPTPPWPRVQGRGHWREAGLLEARGGPGKRAARERLGRGNRSPVQRGRAWPSKTPIGDAWRPARGTRGRKRRAAYAPIRASQKSGSRAGSECHDARREEKAKDDGAPRRRAARAGGRVSLNSFKKGEPPLAIRHRQQ